MPIGWCFRAAEGSSSSGLFLPDSGRKIHHRCGVKAAAVVAGQDEEVIETKSVLRSRPGSRQVNQGRWLRRCLVREDAKLHHFCRQANRPYAFGDQRGRIAIDRHCLGDWFTSRPTMFAEKSPDAANGIGRTGEIDMAIAIEVDGIVAVA
jgi:hypothetical protein